MASPDTPLRAEFDRLRADYEAIGRRLAALTPEVALEQVRAVHPEVALLWVHGSFNEDRLRVLRIRHVVDDAGVVLFDVEAGHDDRAVEDVIDEVNTEYLDLLMDLTGDRFLGSHQITGP